METIRIYPDSSLSDKVRMFNLQANKHKQSQTHNPFSNDNLKNAPKPRFSKDEYGRPPKGSLSETRGHKATLLICKEMLQLCEIIDEHGEPLFDPSENPDDSRKVISFGELFNIYTLISNKLVGMLLRARKHNVIDFEGEVLFQRRDDDVPIIMLKSIEDIRRELKEQADSATAVLREQGEF